MEITATYETDPEKRALLLRKGVYPYEYVDNWQRLKEARLPAKDAFHFTLTDAHIAEEDYEHGLAVWEAFDCATLRDSHDLNLRKAVLLLADVFENFCRMCLNQYGEISNGAIHQHENVDVNGENMAPWRKWRENGAIHQHEHRAP